MKYTCQLVIVVVGVVVIVVVVVIIIVVYRVLSRVVTPEAPVGP